MIPYSDGVETLTPRAGWLTGRGANCTSQFGEDGLVEAALKHLGEKNRWCFEVGAADGFFFSNTAWLRGEGWTAVLIEGDEEKYAELQKLESPTIFTVQERIASDSLDRILEQHGAPRDLDFGVIDIDGQDYWAWSGMREYKPRLILLEFAFKTEWQEEFVPDRAAPGQANYKAIRRLGAEKGYEALAKTHCNILFARSDILG